MHTGLQAYLLSIADEDTGTLVLDAGAYTLHLGDGWAGIVRDDKKAPHGWYRVDMYPKTVGVYVSRTKGSWVDVYDEREDTDDTVS